MKKVIGIISGLILVIAATIMGPGCKKKSDSTTSSGAYALSIKTGAQTIKPGGNLAFEAVLVDKNGSVTTPSNITWTVSGAGGASIGGFSGNTFTSTGTGYGTVTASVTVSGTTYTASTPIGIYTPTVFAVVPSAVIWSTGAGNIPLTPVYIGTGTTTYTYTSSDASVASVDGSGSITLNKAGSCVITVTASGLTGSPAVEVPVLVVGAINTSLPIARVEVSPNGHEMFRGDNFTFTTKAYDGSGNVKSGTASWAIQDPSIATIDQNGKVTAVSLGKTIVTATVSGITGQAEVDVLPDTAIIVAPFWATIAPSGTKQLVATTYKVDHSTMALSAIGNPAISWSVLTYGLPIFDIATVDGTGLVTMRSSATFGLSTVVMAQNSSPTIEPGVAMILVGAACDCGVTTPANTANITGVPATLNLSMTSSPTYAIHANAVDASGNTLSGAVINYCSDNIAACTVGSDGTIVASGIGTSVVTVCDGTIQKTINVTVAF